MLTTKQKELLAFIHERLQETGVPPSFEEMKEALDLQSKSGVHRLIMALEERGFIRRLPHRARAIEVIKLPDSVAHGISGGRSRGFTPSVIEGDLGRVRAASEDGADSKSIRRIEVHGDVVVTQKDQKATADKGLFDMKTNVITLVGNVVISQGQNVVKGDRLSVDLTTSVSRVECAKSSQCRVQALLQPGGGKEGGPGIGSARDLLKPKPSTPPGL